MKTYKNIPLNLMAKIGVLALISFILSSCLKSNTYNPPTALVTFIQASPDEPPLDFYLNNNKVNNYPVNYGNGIDYFRAYAGKRTANFFLTGTNSTVYSDTVTFNAGNVYSVFLANKVSSPELVVLKDSLNKPSAGNSTLRFVNLSPDAPAADLVVKGGATIVSNKAYKSYSSFLTIKGDATYTFEVNQTGTTNVLATLSGFKLQSGFVYTIWFHGLAKPTGSTDGLAADILTNAFYN